MKRVDKMNFNEELTSKIKEVETIITNYLPKEEGYAKVVVEAMNYSILVGGKRIRPMIMQETYRLFGGKGSVAEPFMVALEMIHTYSLVHDDLPALDNDEFRRGCKTTHVVYGEAMAILAGDGLLNLAYETAIKAFYIENDNKQTIKALTILCRKAGISGMIGGQTADIEADNMGADVEKAQLLYIHKNKTAALIESAMMIGAILAGASDEEVDKIEKIAYNVGIAFQIQDDILDVTSSLEILGKQVGSDEKNNKITYVTFEGVEESVKEVALLSNEAIRLLEELPFSNEFLKQLLLQLITREK